MKTVFAAALPAAAPLGFPAAHRGFSVIRAVKKQLNKSIDFANKNDYHLINLFTTGEIMAKSVRAMVVGADRLGNIPDLLRGHNILIDHHVSGRETSHQKKTPQLPSGTDLLILLTDFLGHNVMKTFRAAAHKSGIRVLVCRRSVCSLKQALAQGGFGEST